MKKLVIIITGLFFIVFNLSADSLDKKWFTDYKKAVTVAKEKNLPILALFTGSDWCPYCIKLEKEILTTTAFKEATDDKLVLLYLDFPQKKELPAALVKQNQELKQKYHVQGSPTVIILTAAGKEMGRIPGYVPPKSWFEWLDKIVKAK